MEDGNRIHAAGPDLQAASGTTMAVLVAISFSHLLNDTIQALIPSIYPLIKEQLNLTYAQLGLVTLTFQCTASLLQPVVGTITDRRPQPYSLAIGMACTCVGLFLLAVAHSFLSLIFAAGMVGLGSSVFHPEASRVAHLASGGKRGMAQALFQVGGNAGSSIGPLLAAFIVTPRGQGSILWFTLLAGLGIIILSQIGRWMARRLAALPAHGRKGAGIMSHHHSLPRGRVIFALSVLVILIFSKYVYLTSMTSYYTFFLIKRFGVSTGTSQILLFVFLFAVAAGTILGGPVGDRIGRKPVIWVSILGVAPFTLALPYVSLTVTVVLSVVIGLVLASAFSAILVYAQDLVPGKVGLIAGIFFGLAFGIAGIGSAILGKFADQVGIEMVYHFCSYLPLLGIVAALLPGKKLLRPEKSA